MTPRSRRSGGSFVEASGWSRPDHPRCGARPAGLPVSGRRCPPRSRCPRSSPSS
jgi:hypothetical protein